MSFNYKNPISPLTILGSLTVTRTDVFGTNFSVLGTGGYMEVYTLNDLYYTIPSGSTGLIEYSANTIPIQFNKGIGTVFSPDVLTLNSDNISSGRRRIGMLVYVIDDDQIYQYQIPNFETLWSGATGATGPGGPTVVFSEFGTTVKNNTPEGVSFISAWTANTIEGISGETALTAVWKKLVFGSDFTGGTVTGATIFTNGLTANTFSASTYLGLPADIFITGGTFDNNTDTLTLERSSGSSILVTGFTDYYTTGATLLGQTVFFDRNDVLSAYSVNLSAFSPTLDVHVTGATYDNANTFTFTNNTGGTFDVSFDFVTGLTINGDLTVTGNTNVQGLTATTISATTYQNLPIDPDTYITAFTYSSNTLTIDDNSGNTFNVTINDFTGLTINGDLTVTGNTSVQGLTATTISATTYQGLPTDIRVTGGTYTAGTTTFTNNTGGTFTVTGFTAQDTFTTAFTYSNNTFTISRNQGQPDLTATINIMTGLTVNGNLTVTGNTNVQALTGTSAYLSGSGQNILTVVGSGSSTSSPLMVVSGSSGELFSITDSLVGTLFSVNNLTGNPILSVDSSDIILMGNYLSPSLNSTIKVSASTGTTNVYSIPTSAYTGAFFDYTVNDGTNLRAGNIMSIWSGTTVQYSETSTTDIGNTSGITFNLTISSGNAILRTSGTTSGWTVKTIIRSI